MRGHVSESEEQENDREDTCSSGLRSGRSGSGFIGVRVEVRGVRDGIVRCTLCAMLWYARVRVPARVYLHRSNGFGGLVARGGLALK